MVESGRVVEVSAGLMAVAGCDVCWAVDWCVDVVAGYRVSSSAAADVCVCWGPADPGVQFLHGADD